MKITGYEALAAVFAAAVVGITGINLFKKDNGEHWAEFTGNCKNIKTQVDSTGTEARVTFPPGCKYKNSNY